MQLQTVTFEPLGQYLQESLCIVLIPEADHKVVAITEELHRSSHPRFDLAFHPQIENLMQIHIRQQGTDH